MYGCDSTVVLYSRSWCSYGDEVRCENRSCPSCTWLSNTVEGLQALTNTSINEAEWTTPRAEHSAWGEDWEILITESDRNPLSSQLSDQSGQNTELKWINDKIWKFRFEKVRVDEWMFMYFVSYMLWTTIVSPTVIIGKRKGKIARIFFLVLSSGLSYVQRAWHKHVRSYVRNVTIGNEES